MRINPFIYGVLVLGVFLGVIYGFRSIGVWSISGKVDAQGQSIVPSAEDVETIKGWMTIGEIASAYNVPLAEILAQFQLPADTPPETAIKDLESETFSVSALRDWLLDSIAGSAQPQPLATEGSANPAQTTPTATPPALDAAATQTQPEAAQGAGTGAAGEDHTPAEQQVNGKTTFQDLLDWGVPVEAIRQVIGTDLPTPEAVIKDYITSREDEFSSFRNALQAEVDKLNP